MADPIQGYFNSTTFTLDGNGFPIWNRAVGSTFMAKFAHTVLGNGAAAVTTGGFQVVKKTGMTVTVKPYFICKDGYMMYQTAETDIEFTSSTSEQVFYIGARLDVAHNHFENDDVAAYTTFVSATDIASCKLTITANAVAITDGMIQDLRYNTTYCGQIDAYRERSIALLAELEQALEDTLAGGVPAHASTHAHNGDDPVTPAAIGAAALDANSKVTASETSAYINSQSDSYTLVLTDAGKLIKMTKATASNLTVPPNSSVAFPTGTEIEILEYGAGQVTIVAGSGVTLRSAGSALKIAAQYASVSLKKLGTDEWAVVGALA